MAEQISFGFTGAFRSLSARKPYQHERDYHLFHKTADHSLKTCITTQSQAPNPKQVENAGGAEEPDKIKEEKVYVISSFHHNGECEVPGE